MVESVAKEGHTQTIFNNCNIFAAPIPGMYGFGNEPGILMMCLRFSYFQNQIKKCFIIIDIVYKREIG